MSASPLSDDDLLYRAALARGLQRDDPVVQRRLIHNMRFLERADRDSEALYGDAQALGMPNTDLVVRRRLIERMRLLLQQSALAAEPSDAELQAYLDAHSERFTAPERVRLTQVFLSAQRRGAALEHDAARLEADLTADDVTRAAALGDPLPLPVSIALASHEDLTRLFGPQFAAAVRSLSPGGWYGPLASPYGLHLVWIEERQSARPAELAAVRAEVRAALRAERAATALNDALRALRVRATSAG
jgi:hypothetical protein